MIVLNNISVSFDEKTVLENFSATFEDGKKYAIMGQSGIGKTTILNVIAGLVKARGGTVKNTSGNKISYIFQEPRLYDWMDVTKNVSIVSPLPKKQAEEKAKEILSALGLGDSLKSLPRELSGGMKQRVSIARAIAYEPDVLLLDEPFKALDEEMKKSVAEYLFSAMKGKTVIMVTHDLTDTVYTDFTAHISSTPVSSIEMVKSDTQQLNK